MPSKPLLTAKVALQVARPGARIGCTIIEAFSKEVRLAVRGWGQLRACCGGDRSHCTLMHHIHQHQQPFMLSM